MWYYWPVSILSIFPKIFKGIVYKKVCPPFEIFIIDEQHGFISSKSTTTNLLTLQHHILNAFRLNNKSNIYGFCQKIW